MGQTPKGGLIMDIAYKVIHTSTRYGTNAGVALCYAEEQERLAGPTFLGRGTADTMRLLERHKSLFPQYFVNVPVHAAINSKGIFCFDTLTSANQFMNSLAYSHKLSVIKVKVENYMYRRPDIIYGCTNIDSLIRCFGDPTYYSKNDGVSFYQDYIVTFRTVTPLE
jgi:hypothetical protein